MSCAANAETVSVTLPPHECQALCQLAERTLAGDPAAQHLIQQLSEAASLATWLRDQVRLELPLVDAALLRDLRYQARQELQPA